MSQESPIKVGIIGTGIFAYRHLEAYRKIGGDKFQIVACCNRSKDKAIKFAAEVGIPESSVYTDPQELINDPNVELVDVLLPVQYNWDIVQLAISAKKHVLIEKPIAQNIEIARKIVLAARNASTVVAVAENWSYHPVVQAAAKYVQQGGIGEIVNFSYDSVRSYNPKSAYVATLWRQKPEHPGGYLSDGGVHDMAHLLPILGPFQSLSAFSTQRYEVHGAQDSLSASVKLTDGAIGIMNLTFCASNVSRQTLAVHGTAGTLRMIDREHIEVLDASGKTMDSSVITKDVDPTAFSDVEGEFVNLYQVVRHNATLGLPLEEAFHHLAVIAAGIESSNTESVAKVATVDV
ncbi:hypothetical protein BDF14DRAFT_1735765 [Spinellus fusiger]|nr:hypothetical protein BDF14DRAFT_1735765 [Spinellus fusiger]